MAEQRWDHDLKTYINEHPEDFVAWLLAGTATYVRKLQTEFQKGKIQSDSLLEVIVEGEACLLHIELQSTNDPEIGDRLLDYNLRARREHKLPVFSCVIYLRAVGKVPQSPHLWSFPKKREVMEFDYQVVEMSVLSVEDIWQMGRVGLLPLALLTRDGARHEVVEEVVARVQEARQPDLLSVTELLASLAFTREEDHIWLEERFAMFEDILQETPAYQRILKKGREEEREEIMQEQRQEMINVILDRFPALLRLAQRQMAVIDDPALLLRLLVKISTAPSIEAAKALLQAFSEEEEPG